MILDPKQKTLSDFFSIQTTSTWQIELHKILRNLKDKVWNVSINDLILEYKKLYSNNMQEYLKSILICSIIMKYKSRRLKDNDLEKIIEEEIEEFEETPKTLENEIQSNTLWKMEQEIEKILKNKPKKVYKREKKEIYVPKFIEEFKVSTKKLTEFLNNSKEKEFEYFDLEKKANIKNNLLMTLLYLQNEEKVNLVQEEFYKELKIKAL